MRVVTARTGDQGDGGGGSGDQVRKGPRFPRVLLSDQDVDPFDPAPVGPFHVDERQPPVYQRDVGSGGGDLLDKHVRPLANKF